MKKLFDYLSKFVYLFLIAAFILVVFKNSTYGQQSIDRIWEYDRVFAFVAVSIKVFIVIFFLCFVTGFIGKLVLFIKEEKKEKKE